MFTTLRETLSCRPFMMLCVVTSLFTLGVIVTVWFALRLSSQRAAGLIPNNVGVADELSWL